MTTQLIPIITQEGMRAVSARTLHGFLEVQSRFNDWIRNRIEKYELKANLDFIPLTKSLVSGGIEKDYALSIDTAKELCMVENNEKGRRARRYFIECEKRLLESTSNTPALSNEEALLKAVSMLVEQRRELETVKKDVMRLEAKITTSDEHFFTIAGYCALKRIKVDNSKAQRLGVMCTNLSKERAYHIGKVRDPRFGSVNTYHLEILEAIIH